MVNRVKRVKEQTGPPRHEPLRKALRSRENEVEDQTESKDIDLFVILLVARHFWRHVAPCANAPRHLWCPVAPSEAAVLHQQHSATIQPSPPPKTCEPKGQIPVSTDC